MTARRDFDVLVAGGGMVGAALAALVPSLVLQPLIENALKYAIAPAERGGTLQIGAHVAGDTLRLGVAEGTTKSQLFRARRAIRARLADERRTT